VGCHNFWLEECRCNLSTGYDIVIKLASYNPHLVNLHLAFERMHRYGLKMNPLRCAFGVLAGKFLGFIIHDKGIEIDPKKIEIIKKVQAPTCKRDLQNS
jgi:hypothetical protein